MFDNNQVWKSYHFFGLNLRWNVSQKLESCNESAWDKSFDTFFRYTNVCMVVISYKGSRQKMDFFTVRLTVRGGRVSPLGPHRKQMWTFWLIFSIEIWCFDTQNTFHLIVEGLQNAFFMPFLWFQMIIQRDRLLANDNPEGQASCKWSSIKLPFSCVKSVSEHMFIIWGQKHNKKARKADRKVGEGGSMLTVSLNVKYYLRQFQKKQSMMLKKI